MYYKHDNSSDTTISRRKCTNPSDLVSQATKSPVSTVVGDHTGILGVVFFYFSTFQASSITNIHYKKITNNPE